MFAPLPLRCKKINIYTYVKLCTTVSCFLFEYKFLRLIQPFEKSFKLFSWDHYVFMFIFLCVKRAEENLMSLEC